MLVSQVFFHRGSHAFHLYLNVDKQGDNTVLSTVPAPLLQKLFPNLMATIRFAHVPNAFAGEKYLQMLSERILKCEDLHRYFYPDYLLEGGRVSIKVAEQVINMNEILHMYPRSFYSPKTDKVQFFVLSQMYNRKKRHILRTAMFICRDRFEYEYVLNKAMEKDFELLTRATCFFLELSEEGQIEYALVLDENKELMMLVCL